MSLREFSFSKIGVAMFKIAFTSMSLGFFATFATAGEIVVAVPTDNDKGAGGVLLVLLVLGAAYFLSGQAGAAKATTPQPTQDDSDVIMKF
jgi:hypothetical protein